MVKKETVAIIFFIVLFIVLKVFQDYIPRITDPLSNIIVIIAFIMTAIIYGAMKLRKNDEQR